jgi:hypothetical protein
MINPLRCARGCVLLTPTHFGAAALFNNDATRLLRVFSIDASGIPTIVTFILQGRLTNAAAGTVVPVMTGEPMPPGVIDSDDMVALPTQVDWQGGADFPPLWQGQRYPFAVLRQGFSLVAVQATGGTNQGFSFFWEWCYPEDLYNLSAGDSNDLP